MGTLRTVILSICFYIFYANANDNFFQNKFTLTIDRAVLQSYNKEYFDGWTLKTFKMSRSTTAFNFTGDVLVEIDTLMCNYVVYRKSLQEYKRTAIQGTFDACKALKNNYYGLGTIKEMGNITDCPWRKGRYVISNFVFSKSNQLPPLVPAGEYEMRMNFHTGQGGQQNIYSFYLYVTIKYNN